MNVFDFLNPKPERKESDRPVRLVPVDDVPSGEREWMIHCDDEDEGFILEIGSIDDGGDEEYWSDLPKPPKRGISATKVVGVTYHAEDLQRPCFAPGSEIKLVPEPENPYDPNAVAVYDASGTYTCGHIPKDLAPKVRKMIDSPKRKFRTFAVYQVLGDAGERVSLTLALIDEDFRLWAIDAPQEPSALEAWLSSRGLGL